MVKSGLRLLPKRFDDMKKMFTFVSRKAHISFMIICKQIARKKDQ